MLPNSRDTVDLKAVVNWLRIVFAMMLLPLCLYPVELLWVHRPPDAHLSRTFQLCIVVDGILCTAAVLYVRFVRIPGLFSSSEPLEPRALAARTRRYHILGFIFSLSTALNGFVLALIGGDSKYYVPLYLAGVVLMLVCYPRLPSNDSS